MKHIFKHIAIASIVASGIAFTSCEDMMTVDTGDKAYINANDTLYSYLGIMRSMQDVAERQVILGEIRGDLVSSTAFVTDTLHAISNFEDPKDQTCSMLQVSDYYNVINNCNFYIHNCDTSAIKSNTQFMLPEYAQVKAIRAWAYLQLVKNYGKVPFITEPVTNLDVINNFDYQANLVSKDNLVDRIIEDGLLHFVDTRYPQYGTPNSEYGSWNNGFTDISSRLCYLPIRVILGDLYLLRGASESDYRQAARYYYEYLRNEANPMYLQYCTAEILRNGTTDYDTRTSWGLWASTYSYSAATNEVISLIPGSSNAGLGKMLTRVADIFGYTPTSSQESEETEDTEIAGEYETSGAIRVERNYKRQYAPSAAFSDVCSDQTYVNYSGMTSTSPLASYIENCDARYGNSIENYAHEGDGYPLCSKAARYTTFFYTIPIYRKSLIWLRLAEAINRAGFPEMAFAILKDGINQFTIPKVATHYTLSTRLDANGDSIPVWNSDSTRVLRYLQDTTYYRQLDHNSYGAMYYLTDTLKLERFNEFLDFKDDVWNTTYGIHAKGAGYGNWNANKTTTEYRNESNISGYHDSIYYDYKRLLATQGVVLGKASENDIINAVENIIVDELALETAFEGNRFTDLVRIAEHKNASGYNGTEWLAKKIANRDTKKAVQAQPAVDGFNSDIYSKLLNPANWYFSLPAWSVK